MREGPGIRLRGTCDGCIHFDRNDKERTEIVRAYLMAKNSEDLQQRYLEYLDSLGDRPMCRKLNQVIPHLETPDWCPFLEGAIERFLKEEACPE